MKQQQHKPETETPTIEQLKKDGNLIDSNPVYMAELYKYKGNEYVVLCTNEIISRQYDNSDGEENAIFPY